MTSPFRRSRSSTVTASPPGVYFRLALGGITGHKDLARDTGVIVPPDEAIAVADAILRVFIETGDRTDRAEARLKYVLDRLGFDDFLTLVEEKLGRALLRAPAGADRAAARLRPARPYRRARAKAGGRETGSASR